MHPRRPEEMLCSLPTDPAFLRRKSLYGPFRLEIIPVIDRLPKGDSRHAPYCRPAADVEFGFCIDPDWPMGPTAPVWSLATTFPYPGFASENAPAPTEPAPTTSRTRPAGNPSRNKLRCRQGPVCRAAAANSGGPLVHCLGWMPTVSCRRISRQGGMGAGEQGSNSDDRTKAD